MNVMALPDRLLVRQTSLTRASENTMLPAPKMVMFAADGIADLP